MNNKGKIAISEILILLIGIIAFAYAVGGGISFVKAQAQNEAATKKRALEHLLQGFQAYGVVGGSGGKTPKSSTPTPTSGSGWNPGNLFKYGDTGAQQYYDKLVKEALAGSKEHLELFKAWESANNEVLEAQKKVSEAIDKTGEWVPDEYFELEKAQTKAAEAKSALDAKEKELAEGLKKQQPGTLSKVWDGLVSSLAYGVAAYSISTLLLEMFGAEESYKKAIPPALGAAFFAGRGTYLLAKEGVFGKGLMGAAGYVGVGVGVLVFAWVYSEMYKEESFKVTTFNCYSWKAPTGGEYCYRCNEQELPCSEYQCKSLGQSCELLNDEDSGNQFCAHVNKNDVRPPTIQVRSEALLKDYTYSDDEAISPPDTGVI